MAGTRICTMNFGFDVTFAMRKLVSAEIHRVVPVLSTVIGATRG